MPDRCNDVPSVMDFYIGTYTRGTGSTGIYHLVEEDGHSLTCAASADNPSWLVRDHSKGIVYAVSEVSNGSASGGGVTVFKERSNGRLKLTQSMPSEGDDPCHLTLGDNQLIATNYSSGSVISYSIRDNGELGDSHRVDHEGSGPDPDRQEAAHAHSSVKVNGSIVVADLGTDRLMVYDSNLDLKDEVTMPAGAGPRLMSVAGGKLYVICELSNTIETYQLGDHQYNHIGSVSTLPEEFDGTSFAAHIEISTDGRFMYGSNRGHDSVVVMSLAGDLPRPVQWVPSGGRHPRHFILAKNALTKTESCLVVANRDDNNIVFYQRDSETGLLTDMNRQIEVPSPVCIV